MAEIEDLSENIFVPQNFTIKDKIYNSRILNLIEGIGLGAVTSFLICQIPFVKKLKIAMCIIAFIIYLLLEIRGYKNYSLITSLVYHYRWKKSNDTYHLGNVTEVEANVKNDDENENLDIKNKIIKGVEGYKNDFEKGIKEIKRRKELKK